MCKFINLKIVKVNIQKWHLEIFELSLEKLNPTNPTKEPTVKVGNTLLTFILAFDVKADCH